MCKGELDKPHDFSQDEAWILYKQNIFFTYTSLWKDYQLLNKLNCEYVAKVSKVSNALAMLINSIMLRANEIDIYWNRLANFKSLLTF